MVNKIWKSNSRMRRRTPLPPPLNYADRSTGDLLTSGDAAPPCCPPLTLQIIQLVASSPPDTLLPPLLLLCGMTRWSPTAGEVAIKVWTGGRRRGGRGIIGRGGGRDDGDPGDLIALVEPVWTLYSDGSAMSFIP